MTQTPRYIGTHHYDWVKAGHQAHNGREASDVPRREKNLAVLRDLERRKVEKHQQNLIACGWRPPLTDAQIHAGARKLGAWNWLDDVRTVA